MRKFRFEYGINDDGLIGWKPLWMRNADPTESEFVPHDIMEHFGEEVITLESELMALGAMLYVRAENGFFQRELIHPGQILQNDLDRITTEIFPEGLSFSRRTARLDSYADDYIDFVVL